MAEPNKSKGNEQNAAASAQASPVANAAVSPDVAALIAQVQNLTAQVATLQRAVSAERPYSLPLKQAQDREDEFEKVKAELSKSCLERTQEMAEAKWGKDTKDRYRVKVADQLELLIPARSEEEARGRYDKISGIIGVDTAKHKYQIELVSNAA